MAEELRMGAERDAPPSGAQPPLGMDIGSLLGGILAGATERSDASQKGDQSGDISPDAMRDGIGAVLSDPQMMAKLPDVIAMLKPLMGNLSGGSPAGEAASGAREQEKEGERPQAASHPVSAKGKGGGCHDRRIALLCALRPYLSPRRQEAIDCILRMDKMGKLFRNG